MSMRIPYHGGHRQGQVPTRFNEDTARGLASQFALSFLSIALCFAVLPSVARGDKAPPKATTQVTMAKGSKKANKREIPRLRVILPAKFHSALKERKECSPKCLAYKSKCLKTVRTCTFFKKGRVCRTFKRFCLQWKLKCLKRDNGKCIKEKRICAKPSGLRCVKYKEKDCIAFKDICVKAARTCAKRKLVCCWKRCQEPKRKCLNARKYCSEILPKHCRKWQRICTRKDAQCVKMIKGKCVQYNTICTSHKRVCVTPWPHQCPKHKPWCKCIDWVNTCQSQALICRVPQTICANTPRRKG